MLSRIRSLSLTAKLFLLLLPLAAVPPLAVMAQWYAVIRGELTEEAKRGLEERWTVARNEVVGFLRRTDSLIREVAESPLFGDLFGYLEYGLAEEARDTKAKMEEYFVRIGSNYPAVQRLCVSYGADQRQIRVLRGKPDRLGQSAPDERCPKASLGEVVSVRRSLHEPEPDDEINESFLRYSAPVPDRWGDEWARLTFDVPVSELRSLLLKQSLPQEGIGALLDDRGRIIACAQTTFAIGTKDLCKEAGLASKVRELASRNASFSGTLNHYVVLSRRLSHEGLPWSMALLVTTASFDAIKNRMRWSSILAGGIFFVVAVFALLPLSRRASGPLRHLEKIAHKIASGDFEQELPVTSQDEIGRLASAFNTMAQSLASRDARLRQQTESLAARNEELSALNSVLSRATMSLKLDELLPSLLQAILSVMNLQVGAIRIIDEQEGLLRLVAHHGFSDEYMRTPEIIRVGQPITGQVAETGKPVVIQDARTDPAAKKLLDRSHPELGPLRCFAAVPITAHEKIIGVLALGATGDRTFQETDVSSLISIGLGIGACIENARLFHDLEGAYQRLQMLQEHLIRVEKLSAMGQLVAGVAHEINNPLTAILGYGQLIKAKLGGTLHEEWADLIIGQAERCGKVVEKLLAFARETERKEERIDLAEVIKDALRPAKLSLSLYSVDVAFHAPREECFVRGDRYQLEQVFLNGITNAQHALEDREPPKKLTIELYPEASACVVKIRDNGRGIEPEHLRKVFDPFFTTKPVAKGTGLGLSLSYGIIKEHGGEISIESEAGVGTTLTITLPRLEAAEKGEKGALPSPSWPALFGRHVLVIDDEEPICRYLKEALSSVGMKVTLAKSLSEARTVLRGVLPDVLLVDVRLPDGDGFHLYEEISKANQDAPKRFAFMSGDIVSEKTRTRLKEIDRPYIHKPFGIEDIRRFISTCLEGENGPEPPDSRRPLSPLRKG